MVKINFLPLWHPQTSVPATRAQVTPSFDWLAFAVKLVRNKFYRECQPIKWECYKFYRECQPNQMRVLRVLPRMPANQMKSATSFTANASQIKLECYKFCRECQLIVTCARVAGTEVCGCHGGKKLIFTTVEIDFYHRGKSFFFFLWKIFSIPLISSNKFTQVATALLDLWNFISSSSNKFIQVQPCHHRWPASVSWGLPAEEHESSWNWFFTTVEIDFTTMEVDSYNLGKLFFFLMEMNPSLKHSTGK